MLLHVIEQKQKVFERYAELIEETKASAEKVDEEEEKLRQIKLVNDMKLIDKVWAKLI